jgi:hypothetical protein
MIAYDGTEWNFMAGMQQQSPPYYPELVVNADSDFGGIENANANIQANPEFQGTPVTLDGLIGITWSWVVPPAPQEFWMQAVLSVDPGASYDLGPDYYLSLMQLFTAIQRAGPRLTATNVSSGLLSFSRSFAAPYALDGAYGSGDQGFVLDQEMHYWDSSQRAAGATEPGCYIDVGDGVRYLAGSWPSGDHAHDPGKCNYQFDPTLSGQPVDTAGEP